MQFDINGSVIWDDITAASRNLLHHGIINYMILHTDCIGDHNIFLSKLTVLFQLFFGTFIDKGWTYADDKSFLINL